MALRAPVDVYRGKCLVFLVIILVILALLGTAAFETVQRYVLPTFFSQPGIGVTTEAGGEQVGLSDGGYAFDTNRPDGNSKLQAASAFRQGNVTQAKGLWMQGLKIDGNDAEALIYLEDQLVLASHHPYITLVVGTLLTGGSSDISTGRDDLQGAYVAQKEYNDGFKLPNGYLLRLLIANAGSQASYTTEVANRIVGAAKQDHTIVGVMGWPYSSYVPKAVAVLAQDGIPMVSETASSDTLTGISSDFFRVAPSNNIQAIAGAKYAEQQLHATSCMVFVDPNNSYSASLAKDFEQQFVADGEQIVGIEDYTVGSPQTLPALLQTTLHSSANLIYFAGYADDMDVLLTDFPTTDNRVQILGGDALYQLQGYSSSAAANFDRLHFTAFAYPDEWDALQPARQEPAFFDLYRQDYDPQSHAPGKYGYGRADNDAILSYDAMQALLQGASNVLANNTLTTTALKRSLTGISGSTGAIQGVSGQISFGTNGDPIHKAIVVLYVAPGNLIHLAASGGVQGCFLVGACSNP